jgi:hypothetical protein
VTNRSWPLVNLLMAQDSAGYSATSVAESAELTKLLNWCRADRPSIANSLFRQCLSDSGSRPLCFDHPKLAVDCLAKGLLTPEQIDDLHCGYVYLCGYYFSLDSVVDGHARRPFADEPVHNAAIYLGQLACLSHRRFLRALEKTAGFDQGVFDGHFHAALDQASGALLTEATFRQAALEPRTLEEFPSIVGRASCVPLLFRLCAIAAGRALPEILDGALQKALCYMQLADDLGDWREDLRARRYTSFLRECFGELGRIGSEADVERLVYFGGHYERRLSLVVHGLDEIISELSGQTEFVPFVEYVRAQHSAGSDGLNAFLAEKGATRGLSLAS